MQNVLANRAKNAIRIRRGLVIAFVGQRKAVIINRIGQLPRTENRRIPVSKHDSGGIKRDTIQNFLVSRVKLTIAVHLVTENIGQHKRFRLQLRGNGSDIGFVDFLNSDPATMTAFVLG